MDGDSKRKVMAAGFAIIRSDDIPAPRIKVALDASGTYKTLEGPFKSKAARDRRVKELMQLPYIITD